MKKKDKLKRIEHALDHLSGLKSDCHICPRECGANRETGEKGICQSGNRAILSHALLHYGEEPVLSGLYDCAENKGQGENPPSGSGTIFFSGCNLKCLFCQNYQLSWLNEGHEATDEELAGLILGLQERGALNINLVSPTHLILPILRALKIAYTQGLELPLLWNSNGYEKAEIIKNLEGIVDIYLPDLKYFSPEVSARLSNAPDYFEQASLAIREMNRQQPKLVLSNKEIAQKGLIIRHLVLPGQTKDSLAILEWIRQNLQASVFLSLMSQYHPCFKAPEEIRRPLAQEEYDLILAKAESLGFRNMFIQPSTSRAEEHLIPDFDLADPFQWGK